MQKLQAVEGHNDKVREDLEQHIGVIQKSVTFYENGYNSNLGVLQAIVESLTSILKNVGSCNVELYLILICLGVCYCRLRWMKMWQVNSCYLKG